MKLSHTLDVPIIPRVKKKRNNNWLKIPNIAVLSQGKQIIATSYAWYFFLMPKTSQISAFPSEIITARVRVLVDRMFFENENKEAEEEKS